MTGEDVPAVTTLLSRYFVQSFAPNAAPPDARRALHRTAGSSAGAEWLSARPGEADWLFYPVLGGQTCDRPLCTTQIKNILNASARLAGLTDEKVFEVSGHSLRVGASQELMARGADISTIMRAGGWKTVDAVARYVRHAEHNVWV